MPSERPRSGGRSRVARRPNRCTGCPRSPRAPTPVRDRRHGASTAMAATPSSPVSSRAERHEPTRPGALRQANDRDGCRSHPELQRAHAGRDAPRPGDGAHRLEGRMGPLQRAPRRRRAAWCDDLDLDGDQVLPTDGTTWWNRLPLGYLDTTAPPGTSQTYRIRVTDPFGNPVVGAPATATIAGAPPRIAVRDGGARRQPELAVASGRGEWHEGIRPGGVERCHAEQREHVEHRRRLDE